MLTAIVRGALARPRMVVLAALLLFAYGVVQVVRAKYDVFPEFVNAQSTVQTEAPGLVAQQVELLVTRPLENVLNGANGVDTVRSESIAGLSIITVTFQENADPYRARQVIAEQLSETASRLPAGVAAPKISPLVSSTMDLIKIGLVSDALDEMQLRDIAQWTVRPRLMATPGVARVSVFGGAQRRLEVRVRQEDLLARGVTLADVVAATRAATATRGGGFVDTPAQRVLVEPAGQAFTAEALAQATIAPASDAKVGAPLRLSDVADVAAAPAPKFGDALIMGKPGILLNLSSQFGTNTWEATKAVEAALAELRPALEAQGVQIYPALHRPANFIENALAHVRTDLLVGAVLIGVVLLAFMRDVRTALVTFVSIPLSLLAAVIVLGAMGETINTMTLGGLAVALGVVIDDAIVGVENIVRRLRESPDGGAAKRIILDASVEVRAPVVYATFVLAATMMPILFLSGLQGAFFSPLALSFLLAILASLVVALTVAPALAFLLLRDVRLHSEPGLLTQFKAQHERWLRPLSARPRAAIVALAVAAIATVGSFFLFGHELLPAFRERHYVLAVNGPPGASLAWMRTLGQRIAGDLITIPGIATVEQTMGRAEAAEDTWPPNRSEFHVELKPIDGHAEDQALEKIRGVLDSYPGISTEALTFLGDRIGESLSGETAAVAIGVYGADLDTLDSVANQISATLSKVKDAADVQVKAPPGAPTLRLEFDPNRLGMRGVSATDAYDAVESSFQGQVVGQVPDGEKIVDVAVMQSNAAPADPESAGSILVVGANGQVAPLSDVAAIQPGEGRANVVHAGGRRMQVVTANPRTSDVTGFVARARAAIEKNVALPPGVYLEYAGAAAGQAEAARELTLNVAVAAVFVIALLVLAFGGARAAILILAGAPFALVGGVIGVLLTGGVLSLGALVGFVTLFGIAARNAILLVSHVDHLVEVEGAPWGLETVMRAARERVTPILMTAIVTALGLLPLAIGAGEAGREVEGPMATVILAGLVTSTAMSLLLLPALVLAFRRPRALRVRDAGEPARA
jgi:CzcA family heavy metal efflux pump